MPEKEKINNEELERVAGGELTQEESQETQDKEEKLSESLGFEDIECQFCHKKFPYSRFLLIDWNGKDFDGHHRYDVNTCPECKKTHPFVSMQGKISSYNKKDQKN